MRLYIISILLFVFVIQQEVFSQVVIRDSENKKTVPYAYVVTKGGVLISISDEKGVINLKEIIPVKENEIFINHISYEHLSISKTELLKAKELLLEPKVNVLPELTVQAEEPDYLVLKGYFTTYHTEDDVPKYYLDGIVEYYVPIKKNRAVKRRFIQYRVFKNQELINKEPVRFITVTLISGAPELERSIVTDFFYDTYKFVDSLDVKQIQLIDNNQIVGSVWKDEKRKLNQLEINLLPPKDEKIIKLFGYTVRFTHKTLVENYSLNESDKIMKDDLVNRNLTETLYIKHHSEERFRKAKFFTNLHVFEKSYVQKSALRKVKFNLSIDSDRSLSHYSTSYWKEHNIVLSPYVQNAIDNNVLEICENQIEYKEK